MTVADAPAYSWRMKRYETIGRDREIGPEVKSGGFAWAEV
jgi:hypothetical protein